MDEQGWVWSTGKKGQIRVLANSSWVLIPWLQQVSWKGDLQKPGRGLWGHTDPDSDSMLGAENLVKLMAGTSLLILGQG